MLDRKGIMGVEADRLFIGDANFEPDPTDVRLAAAFKKSVEKELPISLSLTVRRDSNIVYLRVDPGAVSCGDKPSDNEPDRVVHVSLETEHYRVLVFDLGKIIVSTPRA